MSWKPWIFIVLCINSNPAEVSTTESTTPAEATTTTESTTIIVQEQLLFYCGFEADTCGLDTALNPYNASAWQRSNKKTPSQNTGPSAAYNGTYFVFFLSSLPNNINSSNLPLTLTFSTSILFFHLKFAIHAFGSAIQSFNIHFYDANMTLIRNDQILNSQSQASSDAPWTLVDKSYSFMSSISTIQFIVSCVPYQYQANIAIDDLSVFVTGTFSEWSSWSVCSASCRLNGDSPIIFRFRTCYIGTCIGSLYESQECNTNTFCEGTLGDWSSWGPCFASCNIQVNGPYQYRSRYCTGASTWNSNYVGCNGANLNDQQLCNQNVSCPGIIGEWGAWGDCSASCRLNNYSIPQQMSTRNCTGSSFGNNCNGSSLTQTRICNADVYCLVQNQLIFYCGFETDTCGLDTSINSFNGSAWQRSYKKTPSQNTGPSAAYNGTYFIFFLSSLPNNINSSNLPLILTLFPSTSYFRLKFAIHAYGSAIQSFNIHFYDGNMTLMRNDQILNSQLQASSDALWTIIDKSYTFMSRIATIQFIVSCVPYQYQANIAIDDFSVFVAETFSEWSSWSLCSASCRLNGDSPIVSRSRTCYIGTCIGSLYESQECNTNTFCEETLGDWSSWGPCFASCNIQVNGPYQYRSRYCTGASTWNSNYVGCNGANLNDQQLCNQNVSCPGIIGEWGAWGDCSASCRLNNYSIPQQISTRNCTGSSFGNNCNGSSLTQTRICNADVYCPGTLTGWSSWGFCSASCNTQVNGPYQYRSQNCVGASTWNPNYVGCNGANLNDQQLCNQNVSCPGYYGVWNAWDPCPCQPSSSQYQFQMRKRQCLGATLNGCCTGESYQTQTCNNTVSCQDNLSEWGEWGPCSASCQLDDIVPQQTRNRTCSSNFLGDNCNVSFLFQTKNCSVGIFCPGTLTGWSVWSACDASCNTQVNGPYQYRNQSCVGASTWKANYVGCNGTRLDDQKLCNQNVSCPGIYGLWGSWGLCSETCQSIVSLPPFQSQTRQCQNATLNGSCLGVSYQTQSCNSQVSCPGDLTQWSAFSACSQSVQKDSDLIILTMSRQRNCLNSTYSGNCLGQSLTDIQTCNTVSSNAIELSFCITSFFYCIVLFCFHFMLN